jgi:hypothetical protein
MPSEIHATYRIQLHAGFGFEAAAAIVDYLAELGVSHLYCSPYLQARQGSSHGYDVVNPHRVNAELGGAAAHARLCQTLARHGLGQVLDVVPKHMAITGPENPWWWDVLENGPSSRYATYFDVDWEPPETRLRNAVLLPVLGDHYGRVLEAGELRLERGDATFTVRYHDHAFPVSPRTLDGVLGAAAERAQSDELAFGWRSGARRPATSATGASSTSTPWWPCAWRTNGCLPTRMPWCSAGWRRGCSTGSGSTTRTACATPRLTTSGCAVRPRRLGSWSKKSSNRVSAYAIPGRWPAPRAMTS